MRWGVLGRVLIKGDSQMGADVIQTSKLWEIGHALRSDGFRVVGDRAAAAKQAARRGPRVDDRRVLNGIFWILRTAAPRRDLPERYGPYTTSYNRFNRRRKAGVWDRIMDAIIEAYDGEVQMIDSSVVRVHQHAANSKKTVKIVVWAAAEAD